MKGIGLIPISATHYIDHLSVVCHILDIPLLFIDEADFALAKQYYLDVKLEYISYHDFDPNFLIENYDALFTSDQPWKSLAIFETFKSLATEKGKNISFVFCPHGFSDKKFYFRQCAGEDITLIYGQNMLDLLASENVLQDMKKTIITGNYRYTYYKKYKEAFDKMAFDLFFHQLDKRRKTVLYAPTWKDSEGSTSFFTISTWLIENLPNDFNLIIKPHPRLELDDIVHYYQIQGLCERTPHTVFVKDFPLVYPILAQADIYLGDMSAVGYDFLTFNKPMFFLNPWPGDNIIERRLLLYRCGTEIPQSDFENTYSIIQKNLLHDEKNFATIRKEMYNYTFGKERSFEAIKKEIVGSIDHGVLE